MTEALIAKAQAFAPILLLDRAEPFRPVQIGVTEFTEPGKSPSSKFQVSPKGDACYEFAIFWDYDIGHVYDLEHIWVHVQDGAVIAVEASFHGTRHEVALSLLNSRPQVWCEAGKHAHFQNGAHRDQFAEATRMMCGTGAGDGGIHTGNPFSDTFGGLTADDHRLAALYLCRLQFAPAGGHPLSFDVTDVPMQPWPLMPDWIGARMRSKIADLHQTPHMPAIFFDCGDTLVDEGTEIKRDDGSDVVISADLIPGAQEVIETLVDLGYRLCLVADGPRETFENVLKPSGLWDKFEAHVISGDIGVRKPDARMFEAAQAAMGLTPDQAAWVPMIGNNLDRDILGANRAGHPSFFFHWVDRRRVVPNSAEDTPTYTFSSLRTLPHLLQVFEFSLTQDI